MKLHDELYFDITVEGTRDSLENFKSFMLSGELDDFFEFSSDYIIYGDNYYTASVRDKVSMTLANDDFGIEIDSLDPEKLLDIICAAGKNLFLCGNLFDINDEEYRFISHIGDACYTNTDELEFNDELDEEARKESLMDDDEY